VLSPLSNKSKVWRINILSILAVDKRKYKEWREDWGVIDNTKKRHHDNENNLQ
jgi:hypothetical protein